MDFEGREMDFSLDPHPGGWLQRAAWQLPKETVVRQPRRPGTRDPGPGDSSDQGLETWGLGDLEKSSHATL